MTSAEILALPMTENDAGAKTIREYLIRLLWEIWTEGEGFSGKHPFGNSGWQYDVYKTLLDAGVIVGKLDEDGYIEEVDTARGDVLIRQAIISLNIT
jgi:hypothetical protein